MSAFRSGTRWLIFWFILAVSFPCRAEHELILASPHWDGVQYECERAFKLYYREKTGQDVRVHWRDLGGASQIEKAIDASYAATPQTCGIDLLFGGGYDAFERQKAKHQLEAYPLPADELASLPRELLGFHLVDPDSMFYGAALASFGILENVRVVQQLGLPEVTTWEGLADPRLLSWVSMADSRKSGSVHMIYEIILQAYGWDKGWSVLYRMGANTRSFLQSSSAPTKEVGTGDVAYAVTIDTNGMTQEAFLGRDNVRFSVPAGLSIINPDCIAILKGAPHRDVAREFVSFMLSSRGQSLWMKPQGTPGGPVKYGIARMGIRPELYGDDPATVSVPLNPFTLQQPFAYQSALASSRWVVIDDLIGQSIIDVQSSLRNAWKAVVALPENRRGDLVAQLGRPLISEKQASEYAKFWRRDKVRSGAMRNQWMAESVARFRAIEKEARKRWNSGEKNHED